MNEIMAGRTFLFIAFGAQSIEFNMISNDFKSLALGFMKRKFELAAYINDLPTIHADEVMVRPRIGIEPLLIGIHV